MGEQSAASFESEYADLAHPLLLRARASSMRLFRLQMYRLAAPRMHARATTEKNGIVERGVSRSQGGGAGDGGGGAATTIHGLNTSTNHGGGGGASAIPQQTGQLVRISARSAAEYAPPASS